MDLKRLSSRAKDLVEKRGGTDSLKQDAEQLRGIAKGSGSISEKAKAAVSALKDPGADASRTAEDPAPVREAAEPERARADEKVEGEGRGKHKNAGRGRGRGGGGGGRGGRKGRQGGGGDPAV